MELRGYPGCRVRYPHRVLTATPCRLFSAVRTIAALSLPAACVLLAVACTVHRPPAASRATSSLHPWGAPRSGDRRLVVLRNPGYDAGYSPDLLVSRWVAYRYTRTPDCSLPRYPGDFTADPRLDTLSGPQPGDYRKVWTEDMNGCDRGHQAPDAAMKAAGPEAQATSYRLTNITPQRSRFNRGFWRDLEWVTRGWAGDSDTVWVVTGPVFCAGQETLRVGATGRLPVSHAYFEVVARRRPDRVLALLVPHRVAELPWDSAPSFAVSVDSVERLAGLDVFPFLPESLERRAAPPWPGAPPGR